MMFGVLLAVVCLKQLFILL